MQKTETAVPSAVGRRTGKERIGWIDVARGLGIILVVVGHALGGLIDIPQGPSPQGLRYLFLAIYIFHMPVFFLLSGLMIQSRLDRGIAKFLNALLITLVYPYFIWSFIQFTIIYSLGSLVNHPVGNYWATIASLPWQTVSQFWFLHALFLVHMLGVVCWLGGGRYLLLIAAVLLKCLAIFVSLTPAISLAASNAPYYALGAVIGAQGFSSFMSSIAPRMRIALIFTAIIAIVTCCIFVDSIQQPTVIAAASSAGIAKIAWAPVMLPATILGSLALLLVASNLASSRSKVTGFLEKLGKISMPIFLLHILCLASVRILAIRIFGAASLGLLPLLVIAGLAGPVAVKSLADKLRLNRVLGFG